jgi:hypothetical protein
MGDATRLSVLPQRDDGLWDVDARAFTFSTLASTVVGLDWALDDTSVLVLGADGELEVRNVDTGQLEYTTHIDGFGQFYKILKHLGEERTILVPEAGKLGSVRNLIEAAEIPKLCA